MSLSRLVKGLLEVVGSKNSAELEVGLGTCGGVDVDISAEDRQRLAETATGIDPETLRQIFVFNPAALVPPDQKPDPTENR
jgi:hypothetical protein